MKIAAAQIVCVPGEVEKNLRTLERFAERAREASADLVVFPELSDTGYEMDAVRRTAQPWTEGAVPRLCAVAQRLSLAILCGVSERVVGAIFNAQVMINASGEIAGSYRKCHLFRAGTFDEGSALSEGGALAARDFGEFCLGLTICYDLRFPEIYRALATEQAANVFTVSSAWPFPRAEHLRILALARAIENQSYLVLANRVGTDNGVTFCGGSAIIDPAGAVVAAATAEREELLTAELSLEALQTVRERMAVFAHRRSDLYGRMARPA